MFIKVASAFTLACLTYISDKTNAKCRPKRQCYIDISPYSSLTSIAD